MKSEVVIRIQLEPGDLDRVAGALDALGPAESLEGGTYVFRMAHSEARLQELEEVLIELELPYSVEERRTFRPREITEAHALRLAPTVTLPAAAAMGAASFEEICPVCLRGGQQVRELVIDPEPGQEVGFAMSSEGELLVNETVARAFVQSAISGCLLRGTRDPTGRAPELFQLLPTSTLPPLQTPPTRLMDDPQGHCPGCGAGGLRVSSRLYYSVPSDAMRDLNVSHERFDSGTALAPEFVVSQRLWRLLCDCGVKAMKVEPVALV